jgi:hypothetical protein
VAHLSFGAIAGPGERATTIATGRARENPVCQWSGYPQLSEAVLGNCPFGGRLVSTAPRSTGRGATTRSPLSPMDRRWDALLAAEQLHGASDLDDASQHR